jgi:hypothetical protein
MTVSTQRTEKTTRTTGPVSKREWATASGGPADRERLPVTGEDHFVFPVYPRDRLPIEEFAKEIGVQGYEHHVYDLTAQGYVYRGQE